MKSTTARTAGISIYHMCIIVMALCMLQTGELSEDYRMVDHDELDESSIY